MIPLKSVQQKLIDLGYDLGPAKADGISGSMTTAAIKQFQKDQHLVVSWPGTLGPKTYQALGFNAVEEQVNIKRVNPPWITHALTLKGLHEVRDAKKLDKLLDMDASETAWCGAFVGLCIRTALPKEPLPTNPLGSRNWLSFGQKVPKDNPQIGCVAVFWRGSIKGWQGHVGFVVGHDATHVHVLGGNQSDSVSIARVAKDRLLGYRWPKSFGPIPTTKLPVTTINASITTNEA